ncbi:MAG TPA: serine/threonine-protein kinase [Kofleriaceae bacterium]
MDPLSDRPDATEPDVPPSDDPRIGKLVDDRYKILETMAAGSMGAVYKAERVPVGKLVALKFLHASFAKDSEFQLRFERETRVMSKLAHPNCVSVVDFGVWEGDPYLAMDYVAGTTLRALLDKGPLPVGRALVLARQMAAGLAHAHAQGVVHRDVKPANIMISDEVGQGDHVRILDFGLARLRSSGGGRDATQTNVVVGTPNYMAPEQTIGGGVIDARTDIYALGVVLFEMIAGERPFNAQDTMQLLGMHRAAPTPKLVDRLSPLAPSSDIPEGVQELIDKAMAKSPDDRFQTAVELAEAIEELVGPRTSGEFKVPVVTPKRAQTEPPIPGAMPRVDSGKHAQPKPIAKETTAPIRAKKSSLPIVLALAALAAGAFAVWWIALRSPHEQEPRTDVGTAPPITIDAAQVAVVVPDVAPVAVVVPDSAPVIDAAPAVVADTDAAVETGSGGVALGSGSDEIEMDPETADNPDPNAGKDDPEDEDPNAPDTVDDTKPEPPAPQRAKTVAEAIQMIKDGKREEALTSLRILGQAYPHNATIPFLLGNLYFDKRWWSVSMDQYKVAIDKASAYKKNGVLNKNLVKMLGDPRTVRKAQNMLRANGSPAKPYLKVAAKSDKNANVRKYSASLLKQIR